MTNNEDEQRWGINEVRWVIDSESGIRYLIDLRTNKVLMISTGEDDNYGC